MDSELKIRDEEYHDLIKTDDEFKSDELQITTVDISNDAIDNYLSSLKQINRITEIRVKHLIHFRLNLLLLTVVIFQPLVKNGIQL